VPVTARGHFTRFVRVGWTVGVCLGFLREMALGLCGWCTRKARGVLLEWWWFCLMCEIFGACRICDLLVKEKSTTKRASESLRSPSFSVYSNAIVTFTPTLYFSNLLLAVKTFGSSFSPFRIPLLPETIKNATLLSSIIAKFVKMS
jgi:hypothetical protein